LGHTVTFLLETTSTVELHNLLVFFKNSHKQEEAAYYGTSSTLTVVAVENCNPLLVLSQKMRHFVADDEEGVKGRGLMILPVEAEHVL
jgi:hypothetical protein